MVLAATGASGSLGPAALLVVLPLGALGMWLVVRAEQRRK